MKVDCKYDQSWLMDLIVSDNCPNLLLFWGHRAKFDGTITKSCFSQWWPSPFIVDGDRFATAEHWMMAQKAKLFGDQETFDQILKEVNPQAVKALGRKVKNFDANLWDQSKLGIVLWGCIHKFQQNLPLRKFLLSTRNDVLVEASPVDPVWGIGLAQDHKDAQNPAKWEGLNLLGFALMTARDLFKTGGPLAPQQYVPDALGTHRSPLRFAPGSIVKHHIDTLGGLVVDYCLVVKCLEDGSHVLRSRYMPPNGKWYEETKPPRVQGGRLPSNPFTEEYPMIELEPEYRQALIDEAVRLGLTPIEPPKYVFVDYHSYSFESTYLK